MPLLIQKHIVFLALALVGLVGGIDTGLHSVFNCCHDCIESSDTASCSANTPAQDQACKHSCCSKNQHLNVISASQRTKSQAESVGFTVPASTDLAHDCAICQLLSNFHSTAKTFLSQHAHWSKWVFVEITVPSVVANTSRRLEPSRGPPAGSSLLTFS